MVEIVEGRIVHKDSIRDEDWPDLINKQLDEINGPGGGHSKKKASSYDAKTIRHYRDKIASTEVRKAYDQIQALSELFHEVDFAVAVRMVLAYLFNKGLRRWRRAPGTKPQHSIQRVRMFNILR